MNLPIRQIAGDRKFDIGSAKVPQSKSVRHLSLCAVAAIAILGASEPLFAQSLTLSEQAPSDTNETSRLVLVADELIYNQDSELIRAIGSVRIDYGEYQLVANEVEYNQKTGRMRARGQVEMLEPGGNRIFANTLDVTDTFSDGFISALKIETPNNEKITAETAERQNGNVTILRNGTYNDCPQCFSGNRLSPKWKIKVRKIVRNGTSQTIRIEEPTLALFDQPVLRLPSVTLPEPAKKRQSGFLRPTLNYDKDLNFDVSVPYFFAISPHKDATLTAHGYSEKGFMAELEFREKFASGFHTVTAAAAYQTDPDVFGSTTDAAEVERGLIASKGEFELNDQWKFGWDGMLQSDSNFGNTYSVSSYSASRFTNQIYLTGLGKTSFFNMSAYKFDVQDDAVSSIAEDQQGQVYPSIDYSRIFSLGDQNGELKLTANSQFITRSEEATTSGRTLGMDGENGRATAELEWKKQVVADNGLVITPLLAVRGDYHTFEPDNAPSALTSGSSASRGMATAGLEVKYPILATTSKSTHIFEPVAQIFMRNNEELSGGLPNEDAQSFVFDASNLFERDKYSGFDRIEGGTRANLGLRYSGSYSNGFTTTAIFGQSYHLGGKNSFAQTDLTGAGSDSGLETDVSDFVGALSLDTGHGLSLTASGRLDKDNLSLDRSELTAAFSKGDLGLGLTYSYIEAQSGYGSSSDRGEEITTTGSYRFNDNLSVSGNLIYDVDDGQFSEGASTLVFDNSFGQLQADYSRTFATATSAAEWSIQFSWTIKSYGQLEFDELVLE